MILSVQSQVVEAGLVECILQAAQSVFRVACGIVWQQQQQSLSQNQTSDGDGECGEDKGGGKRCSSRQHLAVEVHSAIRAMFAVTAGMVIISASTSL